MRKVIAIGETVYDIIFRNRQPVAAVPGGSCFNSSISMGRVGLPCTFVGYGGGDTIGQQTIDFLQSNGVSADFFELREGEKSALSLAYLNESGDADYVFYKPEPHISEHSLLPEVEAEDVVLMGSYYAICRNLRQQLEELLLRADGNNAIVYYDLNYRKSHINELEDLLPAIHFNFQHSTIVRGSADDFEIMYGTRDAEAIYREHIAPFCPLFLCTAGSGEIVACTPNMTTRFAVPAVSNVVSTVGAGDNFNAGFIYGLFTKGITKAMLPNLSPAEWQELLEIACSFAAEACKSTNNYVGIDFANKKKMS